MARETSSAPEPAWDAIVVGSGPGGLTTAAYLAAAGRRVLVVEAHDLAGGNCQVFRRKAFEFDVGLHYIGGCEPGGLISTVLRGLGLEGRVTFRELDPDGFDTLAFPDFTFRVPRGWDAYRDRLVEQFPDEVAGIDECLRVLRGVSEQARAEPGADLGVLFEWALRSLGELFEHCGLSERAGAVLDHMSGLYASAPSQTSVAIHALVLAHYMGGAYYPVGGGQVLPAGLVDVIESCGGEVRTLARVEELLVADGCARGVRLHGDEVIEAPVVVSNADYKRTMLELVGPQHLAAATIEHAAASVMTLPLVCVYVVIEGDLRDRVPNTNLFVFDSYDMEAEYARLERGEVGDAVSFAYLSLASLKDPEHGALCPPGHTNFQVMTLAPRGYRAWGVEDGPTHGERYRRRAEYRARKRWYTEQLLAVAERAIGPFRDRIVHVETATPLSQERYTRSTGGTSYGLQHSPTQTGPLRPAHRTEIDGLYLVGASTTTGHGIAGTMAGGVMCAGEILGRQLMAEIDGGAVLVDPGSLPALEPARDPVDVCRGKALRELRAAEHRARADARTHVMA